MTLETIEIVAMMQKEIPDFNEIELDVHVIDDYATSKGFTYDEENDVYTK